MVTQVKYSHRENIIQYIRKGTLIIAALLISGLSFNAVATDSENFEMQLLEVQQEWAYANYILKEPAQEEAFKLLEDKAIKFLKANPERAEAHTWVGIVKSSYAGVVGGFDALSLAKESKKHFEKSIKLDPQALKGSAYTSLGILFHKVPSWPISFGDDKKSKKLLQLALEINPHGIDSNYFYAEYMYDKKKYEVAKNSLLTAQKAPARAERKIADEYRHQEVDKLLAKVERKLQR